MILGRQCFNCFSLNNLIWIVAMIRLILFILLLGIFNFHGIAKERLLTVGAFSLFSQSGSSSEFNLHNQHEYCKGIMCPSSNESDYYPDVKKNLFSYYQIIDEIKSNGFYSTDANLFFLIRKDNLFLSILRI